MRHSRPAHIAGYWCTVHLADVSRVRDPAGVKWSTAVGHVRRLAEKCAEMADLPPRVHTLRVDEMWAFGDILGSPRDLDWASAALRVDLPADEVPWLSRPVGAELWTDLTRASKNPVGIWWRSAHAPVWNHRIVGPLLVWDRAQGIRDDAVTALREGQGAAAGIALPAEEEYMARMDDELRVSLAELRRRTREYDTERTTRLGIRADALYTAAEGYLTVLDGQSRHAADDRT